MDGLAAELSQLILGGLPFLIPIVGSIGLFAFLAVESWANSRRKEREAFFRHELLKKLSENPSGEAQQVLALMRQEQIDQMERRRNGIKLGGWISLGTGVGLGVMLSQLAPGGVWAVGALPALIGLAMVVHASTTRAKSAR